MLLITPRRRLAATLLAGVLATTIAGGCGDARVGSGAHAHSDPAASHAIAQPSASAAQATEHLGLALMGRLGSGNLAFSPDSVAAALAMLGTGASGTTATQIARVLNLSPASFAALGQLQRRIAAEQSSSSDASREATTLQIANGMFLQRGYALEAPFTAGLDQNFGTVPESVDFQSPAGTEAINAWAARQTHGLIRQIVSQLPPSTRLALANAIYLKADWSERFKPRDSAPGLFHGEAGTSSTVFTRKTERLSYASGHGYAAVALPYADSTLSLLVMLPEGQSLSALERQVQHSGLDLIALRMSRRAVAVRLPRFHLHTQTVLNGPLQALGMPRAFSESAEFSGITKAEPLKIGEIAHAADFRVDEDGTLATAVTVGTVEELSATTYEHVVLFDADRPFLFFVRDQRNGAVLFAGRLVRPQN